ncbi:hypothetical protein BD626DRAFT_491290 [Schizophyllum amplum]|uniref:Uncharacterized protein n=1 Tax=Schizophyllum amplum TaxID=97359 RepID=A0A550CHJ2_9AGAR|nr:hypothetical protein BD626DRAFT_491290 [Auriculariopsis ampla]
METAKADAQKAKDFKSFLKDPPFLPSLFRRSSTKEADSKDSAELSRLIVEGHDILGQAADLIAQNRWRGDKVIDLDNRWARLYSSAPVLRKITKGRIHPVQFHSEAGTLLADVQDYLAQFPQEPEHIQASEYILPERRSSSRSKHDASRSSSRKHHRNDSLPMIPMTPITEEPPGKIYRSFSARPPADLERKASSRPKEIGRHASDSRAYKSTAIEVREKERRPREERSHRRDKHDHDRPREERRHESKARDHERADGHRSRDKETRREDRPREERSHHRSHREPQPENDRHTSSHRRRQESADPSAPKSSHKPHSTRVYDDRPRQGSSVNISTASLPPPAHAVTYVPYPGESRKHKSSKSHDRHDHDHATSSPHRSSSRRHHSSSHTSKPPREPTSRFQEDLSDYVPR